MADDLFLQLEASIRRKQWLLQGRRRAAPRRPLAWIPQGQRAAVHGLDVGHFVYLAGAEDEEPSAIDPALPVDLAHPDREGEGIEYWLSYRDVGPDTRAAYLLWLAGGRSDPAAAIGYVRLFLYGLERRVRDLFSTGGDRDEVLAIAAEVMRLLGIYGANGGYSFVAAAHGLLDFIQLAEPRARAIRRRGHARHGEVPMPVRIALAERALRGEPVPAALAYAWVRALHHASTPARRCEREFELLFRIRYALQFGDGFVVPPNKARIAMTFAAANPSLTSFTVKSDDLRDVVQLARPLAKLVAIAEECSTALAPYSRFIRKSGRDSLSALALLPAELIEGTHSAEAAKLAALVRSRLDATWLAYLGTAELLRFFGVETSDKISRRDATLVAQALEKLGYGIEPDVRLGGPVFDAGGRVIVFRRLDDCPSAASDEYTIATLCMRLGAIVSAADDDVSEHERALLQQHIAETLELSPGERQRLGAHLAWLLDSRPGTNGLKKQLAALTSSTRRHIGQLLITVATADGRVDPRELKMLEKLYDLIGLETGALYADIHAALASDDEPVAVHTPAEAPKGFAIPPKPATTASGIDMERVRLKIAETRQVSTLLASIFDENETPILATPSGPTIGSLDAAHSELMRRLAERESWPRAEVERLAGELSLMTDGALETINDYAYATTLDAFWEDDDPVAINSHVAMELIA